MEEESKKAGWIQGAVLIVCTFLPIMGIVALMPALPTLMEHFKDISNKQFIVPMLLTAPSLCIAFIAPVAGFLSDKFGRRKLLLTAMLLYGFGGIVPFFIDDFYLIVAGRFCLGVSEAFIMTIAYALFADYYAEQERRKWISLQGVITAIMGTLLILGSGYLAAVGWQWPFIVYALAFPIFILAIFFIWEPKVKQAKSTTVAQTVTHKTALPTIALISLVTLATSILYFVYTIHFSLILDENGIKDQAKIGWITAIASAFVPLGSFFYKRVSLYPIYNQFVLVFFLLGLGVFGVGLIHNHNWILVAACIQQIGCGLTIPMLSGWSLQLLPFQHRGFGMGFWTCALFLGQFLCPLIVALVIGALGSFSLSFIAFGLLCLVIAAVIFIVRVLPVRKASSIPHVKSF